MFRFAGFELDPQRAELRGPDGAAIRLRPKTFRLLELLAEQPRRILSKQELMQAIWPNVHVGDGSLFQCINEIRAALGAEHRDLIKAVSGRGYLLEADVEIVGDAVAPTASPPTVPTRSQLGRRAQLAVVGFALIIIAIAAATIVWRSGQRSGGQIPTLSVTLAATDDSTARMAASVSERLTDGLSRIETIRVIVPTATTAPDYVVSGEVDADDKTWTARARLTETRTGEIKWTTTVSVDRADGDVALQQSRLAAGLGHDLASRLDPIVRSQTLSAADTESLIVVEQATAHMTQTSLERFRTAQQMLETALQQNPGNTDLEVALAAQLMRGVQMVWYPPEETDPVQQRAQALLQHALGVSPNSVPAHEAYCRLLTTINQFDQSLVACARTLSFDPWNGIALYHTGLAQMQLGRFNDALASFTLADRFDTPQVSRWTWTLGMAITYMLLDRPADALPPLLRSIAITPASGRAYFVLAAAYQQLGRFDEAHAAIAKGLELRPGSNAQNVRVPDANSSPIYRAATDRVLALGIAAGLPEH